MNTRYIINYNNKLGAGTFSNVYSATDISGNNYAVKIIDKNNKKKICKMINNEISILNLLKSQHIVNLLDFTETDSKYFLYLEYVELKFINVIQTMLLSDIFNYLKQLLQALLYIQSYNIAHNDIKPANILIKLLPNNNYQIKLCDFGMSADADNNHNFFCGSPIFMNLDRLTGNYKSNSDFWAIKVIYYYMVYGQHPFEGATNIKELIDLINAGVKFAYFVNKHTTILQGLFNNNIKNAQDLLNQIEMLDNNNQEINKENKEEIIISRKPYKDYSIFINISSVNDSFMDSTNFYQKIVDGDFEEFILLD